MIPLRKYSVTLAAAAYSAVLLALLLAEPDNLQPVSDFLFWAGPALVMAFAVLVRHGWPAQKWKWAAFPALSWALYYLAVQFVIASHGPYFQSQAAGWIESTFSPQTGMLAAGFVGALCFLGLYRWMIHPQFPVGRILGGALLGLAGASTSYFSGKYFGAAEVAAWLLLVSIVFWKDIK